MLTLLTLGKLELRDGDTSMLSGRRKPLALLAYLARNRARDWPRESLASLLWGNGAESSAKQSLRQALSELRHVLGPALDSDGPNVRVAVDAVSVDAGEFEQHLAAGRLDKAIALWEGDFLAGLDDLGDESWRFWLEGEREALRARLANACQRRVSALHAAGDWTAAVEAAEQWSRHLPGDERAALALVNALRAAGRAGDAVARHSEAMARLAGLSGEAPSAELVRLGKVLAAESRQVAPELPGARAFMSPDLIGRTDAFAMLTNAWQQARSGQGRLVVIEGDEGLGKTRLCDDFARSVRQDRASALVVTTRVFASERARPQSAIRPILALLAESPGIAAAPPDALGSLARIASELHERFRNLPSGSATDLAENFRRVVADVAAETPLLLVVDDAPDADAASQSLLAGIIRRLPPHVLLVLTGRAEAWRASDLPADVRLASGDVRRVVLAPLTESQVLAMLESMAPLDGASGATLAARLHQASGGNPAQVALLFAQLADDGVVAPDAVGRWHLTTDVQGARLPLPSQLREAVRARLGQLDPAARLLADAAAVAGPRAHVALLESMTGLPAEAFQDAVGSLLTRRILRQAPHDGNRYEYPGEATRRIAYEFIAPSRRRDLHRAAWRALRASDATDGETRSLIAEHRAASGERRLLGVPRRVAAAVGAVVVLLALAGVAVVRTRQQAHAMSSPVLLADVVNLTGDSLFDRALYPAATVALQESRQIAVFPRTRVRETLRLMSRPATDTLLTESLAREVAVRENLGAVIVLSVARFDSTWLLTARAVDPVSGRDVFATDESLHQRADIIAGLDRVLLRTRRALGEPGGQQGAVSPTLPRITTSSLEALRAYADGQRAWTRGRYGEAGDDFRQAVALDSNFAMAYVSLSDLYFVSFNDRERGNAALDRALSLASRLTQREQLALRIRVARYRGPESKEDELVGSLAEQYPNRDSWYSYGTTLMRHRRCPEAIAALQRSLSLDSSFANAHINLATCEQFLGDFPTAVAHYARAWRADSMLMMTGSVNNEWGNAVLRTRGPAAADSIFRRMLRQPSAGQRARGFRSLAYLAMLGGRYHDAERDLDSAVKLMRADGDGVGEWRNLVILGEAAVTAGDTARARDALRVANTRQQSLSLEPFFLALAGHADARAGLPDLARRNRDVAAKRLSALQQDASAFAVLEAQLALTARSYRKVLALLAPVTDTTLLPWIRSMRADAYLGLDRPDSALVDAQALARGFYFGYEVEDEWLRALLRVARIARRLGDSATMRTADSAYLARWKDGDADLPEVVEVRRRLARLSKVEGPAAEPVPVRKPMG